MAVTDHDDLVIPMSWRVYLRIFLGTLLLGLSKDATSLWVDLAFFILAWLMFVNAARTAYREGMRH